MIIRFTTEENDSYKNSTKYSFNAIADSEIEYSGNNDSRNHFNLSDGALSDCSFFNINNLITKIIDFDITPEDIFSEGSSSHENILVEGIVNIFSEKKKDSNNSIVLNLSKTSNGISINFSKESNESFILSI